MTSHSRISADPCPCREGFSEVQTYLESLGAAHVMAYEDLEDKTISGRVKEWTGGKVRISLTS